MNSSIFSFKHLSTLKRFLAEHRYPAIIVLFASVLTVTVCSIILQTVEPVPRTRLDNVSLDKVNVLILGNSQLIGLLDGDERMLNLSLGGSDYTVHYQILRHVVPRLKNLRFVILGFDNIPLRTPAIARMKGDYRSLAHVGIPWHAIPEISPIEKVIHLLLYNRWFRPLFAGPKFDADRILPLLRGKQVPEYGTQTPPATASAAPDVLREGFYLTPSQGSKKISDYLQALEQNNNLAANLTALQQITDYCRNSNIGLVLVRPPTTADFIAGRSEQWHEELARVLSSLRAGQPGSLLPFWDAEQMDAYGLEYFDDPNHLSTEGKRRYSSFLMSTLEPMLHN